MEFFKINEIESLGQNYQDAVFLTFDIDWACDDVLQHNIDLIENNGLKATFFVTHETPLLDRMRENPNIELGIHPNFNFLIEGDFRYGKNYREVTEYYLKMVPDAVSIRSHTLVQGSQILETFEQHGLKYDVNLLIPQNAGMTLKPFVHWNQKMQRLPYFWEDDVHIIYDDNDDVKIYLNTPGLKIFDFHPIHLFLNTENLDRYTKSKPHMQDVSKLNDFINRESFGTLDFFNKLVTNAKS